MVHEETNRFEFKIDKCNNMLIGPEGCHYDTEAGAMYFDQLKLCGCGSPNLVHKLMIDCLLQTNENIIDHKKIVEIVKQNSEVVAEFILHFLADRNLTEHGSSIYGSWLTERGKQFIEIGAMKEDS